MNTTLREVNIELDENDWDERRNVNKRKKLILEGKDPDEVLKEAERRRKKERKREKKARLKAAASTEKKSLGGKNDGKLSKLNRKKAAKAMPT